MTECIFCKIAAREMSSDIVYEDDDAFAFRDINPQAPFHILVVPKEHVSTINDLEPRHAEVMGKLYLIAKQIVQDEGYSDRGYRTVMNCGAEAGQSVFHAHLHVLAGRSFSWPPG